MTSAALTPRLTLPASQRDCVQGVAAVRPGHRVVASALPAAVDAAALAVAALTVQVVLGLPTPGWAAGGYAALLLALLASDGQHRTRICARTADRVPRVAAAAALAALLLAPWLSATDGLTLAAASTALVAAFRTGAVTAQRAAHRRGRLVQPTLIIGADDRGVQLARLLTEHPELGLRPCGFLDGTPPPAGSRLPVLGGVTELARVVAEHGVTRVLVATPDVEDAALVSLLRAASGLPVDVYLLPRLPELGAGLPHGYLDEVWGVPLVPLRGRRRLARPLTFAAHRVVAAALLVLAGPLLLLLAAAVRLADGRPVLFGQTRAVGTGRFATVRKLRTMDEHADSDTRWAVSPADCTRLGGWLRTTHLDELPQLVNVLRGEMALVGPRPERPHFAAAFGRELPHYDDRHRVRAGMTGWAQVHGLHGDSSIADRARFDNQYIEYWSPWLDVVILARTLASVLRGSTNARRGGDR